MITNIVFDFDGTLVDSNQIKKDAFFKVTERLGNCQSIVWEVLSSVKGDRAVLIRSILNKCAEKGLLELAEPLDVMKDLLVKEYSDLCEAGITACAEIKGSYSTLSYLAESGHSLFLNSATPTSYLKKVVELRKMTPFFKGIYGAPANKLENLYQIKKDFNIEDNSTILLVGDGEDDFQASLGLPCIFVGVVHKQYQFAEIVPFQITNMEQLPDILMGIVV